MKKIESLLQESSGLIDAGGWLFSLTDRKLLWTQESYLIHDTARDFAVTLESMCDLYQSHARDQLKTAFEQLIQYAVPFDLTLPLLTSRQTERWVRIVGRRRQLPNGDAELYGAVQNVQQYKERELQLKERLSRLHYLAHHDPLTDLPNRLLFSDRLQHALMRSSREKSIVALLVLDLDGFKTINDSLGHDFGDQLLQVIAKRLRKHLRVQDTAARLGGDEFVVILESVARLKEVTVVAEKILKAITRPLRVGIHELTTSASMGISLYPSDGTTAEILVKHADIAMYRAKELGKNNYQFFTADLNRRALKLAQIENDLRHAIEQKQFVLHFQPIFAADTDHVIGAEALVRWQHPTRGLLKPADFISAAEETGLITPLGKFVADSACTSFKHWLDEGLPLQQLSINVSGVQLRHNIQRTLRDAISDSGLDPHYLTLDINEQVIADEVDNSPHFIQELKNLGVNLAIDDFGTGHSSLPHLQRLPLTAVKIDRRFIQHIASDNLDEAVVVSAIAMAHHLGVKVIAEGVDAESQLQFLREQKCDFFQGYHLGEPLPAEDFRERVRRQQAVV